MTAVAPPHTSTRRAITWVVAALWLGLDQLTKWIALNTLDDGPVEVVWTLQLRLAYNSGMAFSRGRGLGPVIGVVALLVVVGLLIGLRRPPSVAAALATALVVGGALGNVTDRLFRAEGGFLNGAVVDFIDFQWWPVFNVADIGVVVGGLALVALAARGGEQRRPANPS